MVCLRDEDLFGEHLGAACVVFVRRVFALNEVKSVEIDFQQTKAEIRFDDLHLALAHHLERLAVVIRGQMPRNSVMLSDNSSLADLRRCTGRIKILRFDTILTTWDIVNHQNGRIRLRHNSIRNDPVLARRIQNTIEDLAGVLSCSVQPLTGSVLIRFNPMAISASRLLQILERECRRPTLPDLECGGRRPAGFGPHNISVALAIVGELAVPALLPVCAIVLMGSNLGTFRAAGRQLFQGQLGLSVLYASIVAVSLASGQFIASATMSWMFIFWNNRYCNEVRDSRRRLLSEITRQSSYARLVSPDISDVAVDVPIKDLKANDVILITSRAHIPVDGRVLKGEGLVDERLIRGAHGLNRKRPDDVVLAGSTLLCGKLQIQVLGHGLQTQAGVLAQVLTAVTSPASSARRLTLQGEEFAERAILPTMVIAGLGFLMGDISTAGAILRLDYATGPGLAIPLETLQAVTLCMRHGIVVREHEAIKRVATSDLLFIEHSSALERTQLELVLSRPFPALLMKSYSVLPTVHFTNLTMNARLYCAIYVEIEGSHHLVFIRSSSPPM